MSKIIRPAWVQDGAATVLRIIGSRKYLSHLDPFVLLDFAKFKLPVGFQDHPHRGIETVGYCLSGSICHDDSIGNRGMIGPGAVNRMTAGKGIMHCQMPASFKEDTTLFQLWMNLQSKNKFISPAYQQWADPKLFPIIQGKGDAVVKVIAGSASAGGEHAVGPIKMNSPIQYLDIDLGIGGIYSFSSNKGWNTMIFPYQGSLTYQCNNVIQSVEKQTACILNPQSQQHIFRSGQARCKFILLSGQPLNQPIQRIKYFVMNTKEQLEQVTSDWKEGKNGFENANMWKSKISQMANGKKFEDL